uniref:exodeoxyribonuclease III n=1 Tax=Salmo trutta TaxID=8032 RepID=A0A674B4E4_SALTR
MELSTENSLSIITWNTCGVKPTKRYPNKLIGIIKYVKKQNTDIIFLQETHIGPTCYRKLEQHGWEEMERHWTSYFTVYSPNSKGVAILVNKKLKPHYEYICHDEDYAGGYIVLFCQMYGQLFTLVNVYNHKQDKQVLGRLSQYLQEMKIGTLVIGGDFNTVLDLDFDKRTASEHKRHTTLQPLLQSFISSLNLQDTWARLQPTEEAFTRSQNTSHSRLDMFFMQQDKAPFAQSCEIHTDSGISDHNPVSLKIHVPKIGSTLTDVHQKLSDAELKYKTKLDRRAGQISGAEVLVAMKSLTDSSNGPREGDLMETETLKHEYNEILSGKRQIPDGFNMSVNREKKIFATILANRLQMYLEPSFTGSINIPPKSLPYIVYLGRQPLIKSNFLKEALLSIDIILSPPRDFTILKQVLPRDLDILWKLLPMVEGSSGHKINLQDQCPLTPALLYLCLKYMEHRIQKTGTVLSVSRQRLSLFIHMEQKKQPLVIKLLFEIRKESDLSLRYLKVTSEVEDGHSN